MIIATHDGSFHADETTACAILTYIYENSTIIRSRKPDILETADIIIDVSGLNDEKHFDHHSNNFTEKRSNGICYATAGLMWEKFGLLFLQKVKDNFLKDENIDADILQSAFLRIDKEIMTAIDLNDNGHLNQYLDSIVNIKTKEERTIFNTLNEFYLNDPSISYIVAMQNIPNASSELQNKMFNQTVDILQKILINASINALYTEHGIKQVLDSYNGKDKILILQKQLPWKAAVLSHFDYFKNCYLAIYPDKKLGWRIQSLPFSTSELFKNKLRAPISWRGLDNECLDAITHIPGGIFVHKAGFTGGNKTFENTLLMAQKWLNEGEADI